MSQLSCLRSRSPATPCPTAGGWAQSSRAGPLGPRSSRRAQGARRSPTREAAALRQGGEWQRQPRNCMRPGTATRWGASAPAESSPPPSLRGRGERGREGMTMCWPCKRTSLCLSSTPSAQPCSTFALCSLRPFPSEAHHSLLIFSPPHHPRLSSSPPKK